MSGDMLVWAFENRLKYLGRSFQTSLLVYSASYVTPRSISV